MTKQEFLRRLKAGLSGLSPEVQIDIMRDYERHFDDAAAEGRKESDVAEALGDPARLARELRAEAGMKRWEDNKSPSSAATAIFALVGLGALDILILLPILMGIASVIGGFFIASIVLFFVGVILLFVMPFSGIPGGFFAGLFVGVGIMALSVFLGTLLSALTIGFVNFLVWFARLHYRLIKPAFDQATTKA